MSQLGETFDRLRAESRTGLVTYVTAGDPDEARSEIILRALDRSGADVLEVGVPFSDPLADGPAIQRATERALEGGTTLRSSLALIGRVRADVAAPVVVFTYANPLLRMGMEDFMTCASDVGVDGLLVLDLPIEEAGSLRDAAMQASIDPIFLLSPTTTERRIRIAAELGGGFLYAISRLGVTGERDTIAEGARDMVNRIREVTEMPIALGFGISHPDHVAEIGRWADAAVVGSGLVNTVAKASQGEHLADEVSSYVRWLKSSLDDDASGRGGSPEERV